MERSWRCAETWAVACVARRNTRTVTSCVHASRSTQIGVRNLLPHRSRRVDVTPTSMPGPG
jgi:hypothetical protein